MLLTRTMTHDFESYAIGKHLFEKLSRPNPLTNIEETAKIADTKFIMTVLGVDVVVCFDIHAYNASHVSFSFTY